MLNRAGREILSAQTSRKPDEFDLNYKKKADVNLDGKDPIERIDKLLENYLN